LGFKLGTPSGFAPSWAAITISDMDKNDSCSSGFHHAVKQMPEYLTIRCIDNNHSLNVILWVSNWGQATANFAPSCAAITISDIKDITDSCSSGFCHAVNHFKFFLLT
jgi:hypothetical protein